MTHTVLRLKDNTFGELSISLAYAHADPVMFFAKCKPEANGEIFTRFVEASG